jgi:hypothetical protein
MGRGNFKRYGSQVGSSSFSQARYEKLNWAYPGSTLMDVVLGRGHTIWKDIGVASQLNMLSPG